jgi:hypothetical protein
MEPFQFLEGTGNENDVTVSIFIWSDVTVTFWGNDAHLCPENGIFVDKLELIIYCINGHS